MQLHLFMNSVVVTLSILGETFFVDGSTDVDRRYSGERSLREWLATNPELLVDLFEEELSNKPMVHSISFDDYGEGVFKMISDDSHLIIQPFKYNLAERSFLDAIRNIDGLTFYPPIPLKEIATFKDQKKMSEEDAQNLDNVLRKCGRLTFDKVTKTAFKDNRIVRVNILPAAGFGEIFLRNTESRGTSKREVVPFIFKKFKMAGRRYLSFKKIEKKLTSQIHASANFVNHPGLRIYSWLLTEPQIHLHSTKLKALLKGKIKAIKVIPSEAYGTTGYVKLTSLKKDVYFNSTNPLSSIDFETFIKLPRGYRISHLKNKYIGLPIKGLDGLSP